jgi:hypothetical protein
MKIQLILTLAISLFSISSLSSAAEKKAVTPSVHSAPAPTSSPSVLLPKEQKSLKKNAENKFDCNPFIEKIRGLGKQCLTIEILKDRVVCWNKVTAEIGDGFKHCDKQLNALQKELSTAEKQLFPKDKPGLK